MGNASDKISDNPPTPQEMDMSPSAGDQSISLEWFDAPESTSPPAGSVVVSVKVVSMPGGDVQAFWNGATQLECAKEDGCSTPTKTSFGTARFLEINSRSPTSRFLSSKTSPKRTLIARLHPFEQRFILKKPKKGRREEQAYEKKSEDMVGEETKEEDDDLATKEEENEEKTNENLQNEEDNEKIIEVEFLSEEDYTGSFTEPTTLSNTPDVLSDISSDIPLGSAYPSPTLSSTPPFEGSADISNLTDADMKRQKKRERKKARQLNKEQQMKRQRLQRAEAIKSREEKIEREKQQLVQHAAAVAKPTLVAACEQPAQQHHEQSTEETTKLNVSLENIEVNQKEEKDTTTTATATLTFSSPKTSSALLSSPLPEFSCDSSEEELRQESKRRFAPSKNRDVTPPRSCTPKTREDTPLKSDVVSMVVHEPKQADGMVELKTEECSNKDLKIVLNGGEAVQEVVQVESLETFEVLVCGERRKVTPFIPRKKLSSISTNSDDVRNSAESPSSSNSVFDIPEHPPVVVPFRDAPMVSTSSSQLPPPPPPQMHPSPPPQYVTMPISFNSQPNHPVIVGGPMMSSFGPVQSRYIPMPPGFGPQQYPPVNVVPVSMQRIPMQRMPPMPVMMNRPMFVAQPHPGPHRIQMQPIPLSSQQQMQQRPMPSIPVPPPSHMVPMRQPVPVFASHRQLLRPTRNPLPITAPPEAHKSPKKEKPVKSEPKKKPDKEKKSEEQKRKKSDEKEEPKEQKPSTSVTDQLNVVEEQVVVNQKIVAREEEEVFIDALEVLGTTVLVEETITLEESPSDLEPAGQTQYRRSSSFEFNGELIAAGVAAVLEESDDDLPPVQSTSTPHRPLSPTSEAQQEAINRVLGYSKQCQDTNFDIWAGWMNEMPPSPKSTQLDKSFKKLFEEDQEEAVIGEKDVVVGWREDDHENLTLVDVCKKVKPYFVNSRAQWSGATVDGDQLRDVLIDAYNGSIPSEHWAILDKVCSFKQGYIQVFDVMIGNRLDLSYKFVSTPESKKEKSSDDLYKLYQSLPPVDGVEKFFKRFEENIIPELLKFISNRFVSVRVFVAIAEVVKGTELSVSDLYYLATLVFGARQFFTKFNGRIKQFHIIETGGTRWIRQTMMDELRSNNQLTSNNEDRMKNVADFLTGLRPYIDDILQLLPDAVVNDDEFFKSAKLVCGWDGENEERIWQSIIKDRAKFQEFYDAYRPFLRIEIRMGTIYLRKLTYDDDYGNEADDAPLSLVVPSQTTSLVSALKSDDRHKEKNKRVSYAAEVDLIAPSALAPAKNHSNRSTQTHHVETERMWDLERQVIRQLKRDNVTFAEFIKTDDAREMHQFLIDTFKEMDLRYFAFILEKAMAETREKSWQEANELRLAAEEARSMLETAREQHRKEFGELRSRMETISRFETYEVEVASSRRIDGLQERINQLNQDRELLLREEVKEERARLQRQMKEMKDKHSEERRAYASEITRLRQDNSQLSAIREQLEAMQNERADMVARCEIQMNKAKEMCVTSSRLLQDSQREIEALRERSLSIAIPLERPSILTTPDSEPEPEPTREVFHPVSTLSAPPSSIELSAESRYRLKLMEKYAAEFDVDYLRSFARELLECYNNSKANHKERKAAEKQLKEYEASLDYIDNAIKENIEMLNLNVVEGLIVIPHIPMPFSENTMQKMFEYSGCEMDVVENREEIIEEEDGCLICTEAVEETCETVKCDTCTKEYHYHCISQWLKINSVCPACSRALKDPNEYPRLE